MVLVSQLKRLFASIKSVLQQNVVQRQVRPARTKEQLNIDQVHKQSYLNKFYCFKIVKDDFTCRTGKLERVTTTKQVQDNITNISYVKEGNYNDTFTTILPSSVISTKRG